MSGFVIYLKVKAIPGTNTNACLWLILNDKVKVCTNIIQEKLMKLAVTNKNNVYTFSKVSFSSVYNWTQIILNQSKI